MSTSHSVLRTAGLFLLFGGAELTQADPASSSPLNTESPPADFARWTDADGHKPWGPCGVQHTYPTGEVVYDVARYYGRPSHNSAYDYCLAQAAIRPEVIAFSYAPASSATAVTGNCWLHLGVDDPNTPESDKAGVGGLSYNDDLAGRQWIENDFAASNTEGVQGTVQNGEAPEGFKCHVRVASTFVDFRAYEHLGYCISHGQPPVYYSKSGVSLGQCTAEAAARAAHGVAAFSYELFTAPDATGTCHLHTKYDHVALPYETSSWTKCQDLTAHTCNSPTCVEGEITGSCGGFYYMCYLRESTDAEAAVPSVGV